MDSEQLILANNLIQQNYVAPDQYSTPYLQGNEEEIMIVPNKFRTVSSFL